jgi:hypothetical protein
MRRRRFWNSGCRLTGDGGLFTRLQFEPKRNRRIVEADNRVERYLQSFRPARKIQADLESVSVDRQIPKFMLQNNRHFVGIFLPHRERHDDARRLGLKSDVEVMLAGQAVSSGVGQHTTYDKTQGVLHQKVIADQIGRHWLFTLRLLKNYRSE